MKAILRSGLILSLTSFFALAHSQTCSRQVASFDAAPGGYDISGTALLEMQDDSITLSFDSAFSTLAGPDLHAYLAINFESPTADGNTNVDLGLLASNSGAQSFGVPDSIALDDYDYVLIHCKTFNHWWGGGLLGDIDCVSAVEPVRDEMSVVLYPNPASTQCNLHIKRNNALPSDALLKIIDDSGRTLKELPIKGDDVTVLLDLKDIAAGTYFAQLSVDGHQQITQKMVVIK